MKRRLCRSRQAANMTPVTISEFHQERREPGFGSYTAFVHLLIFNISLDHEQSTVTSASPLLTLTKRARRFTPKFN